ncbi:hypothetical protein V6N13_138268 [Hibiscus sabdariffa]
MQKTCASCHDVSMAEIFSFLGIVSSTLKIIIIQKKRRFRCAMDWASVQKSWEKWASANIGSSGQTLKAALLINYDPLRPSRLLSTIAEQEGMKISPIELSQFISFIKRNKLQKETFVIGNKQYMVTSIHENWFCARCLNASKSTGEGAIVMQTSVFLLVALYDGSIGLASRAVASVDQLAWTLNRRNL